MSRWRWFSALAAVVLLLAIVGPAAAAPPEAGDGLLPPGLAVKVFIHYPRGSGPAGADQAAPSSIVGNCADTSGTANCNMYGYSGLHWATGSTVSYYVNPNFSARTSRSLTRAQAATAIQQSFATWDAQTNRLAYSYRGITSAKPGRLDGVNVVGWGSLQRGVLAVTKVWYYTATQEIAQFDITFSNNYAWTYTPPGTPSCGKADPDHPYCDPTNTGPAGTYDVQDIGTHEAGHTLMLDDLYDPSASDLTMYGYGAAGELIKDTLGRGDVLGVQAAYP